MSASPLHNATCGSGGGVGVDGAGVCGVVESDNDSDVGGVDEVVDVDGAVNEALR